MFTLPVSSLKPGMILFDDIYNFDHEILLKSNVVLTDEKIKLLADYMIDEVDLAEPDEAEMTRYSHLHASAHFQRFEKIYTDSLTQFMRLIHNLDTGLELNLDKMLRLRDDIANAVMNGEQLLDYLYNLMPNENEITYNHCFNCGLLCYYFAKWCDIPQADLDMITLAGFLFDIGKTKVHDELLWKPGKLTPEEFIQMQHHIHLGYEMLKNRELPPHVITVMIMHHERCDGSGYPARLKKSKIDPYALLAAIADTYEAMTHPRAQRTALTPFQAIRVFEEQGFAKYGEKNTKIILTKIANMYEDRKVVLSNGFSGRISEIHEEALSRPTIFGNNMYFDLRESPNEEIVRMA